MREREEVFSDEQRGAGWPFNAAAVVEKSLALSSCKLWRQRGRSALDA